MSLCESSPAMLAYEEGRGRLSERRISSLGWDDGGPLPSIVAPRLCDLISDDLGLPE